MEIRGLAEVTAPDQVLSQIVKAEAEHSNGR